jgi:adenylate cyclase
MRTRCAPPDLETSLQGSKGCFIHLHGAENKRYPRTTVLTAEIALQAARRQLEKVVASAGFSRNERLVRFLRFVVEQHLEGKDDELKESVVAVEVFGRSANHNPKQHSIVRTEAGRLRARLSEYYAGEGLNDPLIIELPKGGYVPVLRQAKDLRAGVDASPAKRSHRVGRSWFAAGMACMVVALTLVWWFGRASAPTSIAVLPLLDASQDPANDYFTVGLTGEIIHDLSIIDGLVVRSQTSSYAFKGKPQNVRDAGKQLNVDYILEGNTFRAGRQLRINVQLIRVRDDFPLWSGQYGRELTDVFAIQDEISRGIVNSLRLKLGRGRRRYETSAEAYDLYLRARALEIQNAAGGRNQSTGFYEQAIAKDASFAPAYAGLAAAYAYRTGEDRLNGWAADASRAEEMSRMHVVVEKAVQLDPLSAEVQAALGTVQARDAQWEQSEKSFRRAVELEPGRSATRTDFALSLLMPLGRLDEALTQARLAEKNDPLSPNVQQVLSNVLFSAGRLDEAAAHCKQPCVRAMNLQGKASEAIPILEARLNGQLAAEGSQQLGIAYARAGRREDAERIATIQARPIEQATIFVALGDKDRAFEALNRAIPLGPVRVGRNLYYPEFAALRGDQRLKTLRKQLGLPE